MSICNVSKHWITRIKLDHLSTLLALPTSRPLSQVRSLRLLPLLSVGEEVWATAFEHVSAAIKLYPKLGRRAFNADDQQKAIQQFAGATEIAASCALNACQDPKGIREPGG
jgi:hypothetical protein